MTGLLDRAIDLAVVPGYSRIGYALRGLDWEDASRALQAGGSSVFAPEKTEWGTERPRVLDPEGYEWSFGTYEPGGS